MLQNRRSNDSDESRLKIYFLPNLLTAGNLFCGFVALTKIVEADPLTDNYVNQIYLALMFILLACICDLLDGRVARWGGAESPFGREFDSLADLISFGVAPAFLVHRIVLRDVFPEHPEIGWFIASIYLICGAFRLARFNVLSAQSSGSGKDFLGFPIPSAAALVASLTLFIMWVEEKDFAVGNWRYLAAGAAAVFVVDDGESRALSELQVAGLARDADVHQDASGHFVRWLRGCFAGKNSGLHTAAVFHGLSDLRLCATAPFARVAPGN